MREKIDLAIIGAGPAGMSAAQYGARGALKTVLFEGVGPGGQALLIEDLENYPAMQPRNGFRFAMDMLSQAERFGAKLARETVEHVGKEAEGLFVVETNKQEYEAQAVIIATGAKAKTLAIKGEQELIGKGVSYCASCDGPFFKGKKILVVGGGDSACDEANHLSKLSEHITIVHRKDRFRAQKAVAERVLRNPRITTLFNTELHQIFGKQKVEEVELFNNVNNSKAKEAFDAVFILIGNEPQTQLFPQTAKTDEGYIVTDYKLSTNIPGLFAAGDVRDTLFRQVITACADGAAAAFAAGQYIDALNDRAYS